MFWAWIEFKKLNEIVCLLESIRCSFDFEIFLVHLQYVSDDGVLRSCAVFHSQQTRARWRFFARLLRVSGFFDEEAESPESRRPCRLRVSKSILVSPVTLEYSYMLLMPVELLIFICCPGLDFFHFLPFPAVILSCVQLGFFYFL